MRIWILKFHCGVVLLLLLRQSILPQCLCHFPLSFLLMVFVEDIRVAELTVEFCEVLLITLISNRKITVVVALTPLRVGSLIHRLVQRFARYLRLIIFLKGQWVNCKSVQRYLLFVFGMSALLDAQIATLKKSAFFLFRSPWASLDSFLSLFLIKEVLQVGAAVVEAAALDVLLIILGRYL